VLRNYILHITIPPHFKVIISVRSELLAPAVCTNRETDTFPWELHTGCSHSLSRSLSLWQRPLLTWI